MGMAKPPSSSVADQNTGRSGLFGFNLLPVVARRNAAPIGHGLDPGVHEGLVFQFCSFLRSEPRLSHDFIFKSSLLSAMAWVIVHIGEGSNSMLRQSPTGSARRKELMLSSSAR